MGVKEGFGGNGGALKRLGELEGVYESLTGVVDGGCKSKLGGGLLRVTKLSDSGGEGWGDGDLLKVEVEPFVEGESGASSSVETVDFDLEAGDCVYREGEGELRHEDLA